MVRAESPDKSHMFGLTLKWQTDIGAYGRLCEERGRHDTDAAIACYELAERIAKLELEARKATE